MTPQYFHFFPKQKGSLRWFFVRELSILWSDVVKSNVIWLGYHLVKYHLVRRRLGKCYLVERYSFSVTFDVPLFELENIQFSPVKIQLRPPAVYFVHSPFFRNYVTNLVMSLETTKNVFKIIFWKHPKKLLLLTTIKGDVPPRFNSVQFLPSTTPFRTR